MTDMAELKELVCTTSTFTGQLNLFSQLVNIVKVIHRLYTSYAQVGYFPSKKTKLDTDF